MKTSISKVEKNRVKVAVEVEVEKLDEAVSHAYKELANKAKIPGFRKGKIPPQIIDRNFGKDYVLREALDEFMPGFYLEAVYNAKIKPVDKPQIEVKQLEDGKPLQFDFDVTVEPEVKIKKYKGYELTDMLTGAGDEEIEEQLKGLALRFSKLEVSKRDGVYECSFPVVDIEAEINGSKLDELCEKDYIFEIGKGMILPEIEQVVINAKRGEQREARIVLNDSYPNEKLRGQEVLLKITVKEIKERILPEINDEFAKNSGGFDNVLALKDFLKERIESVKKSQREESLNSQALKLLEDNCEMDIPEVMIENRVSNWLEALDENLSKRKTDRESYLKTIDKTNEQLLEEYRSAAVSDIKHELNLEKIAEMESLEVSEEEIQNRAKEISEADKKNKDRIYGYYSRGIGAANLKMSMLRKKALDLIIVNAKLKEKTEKDGTKKKGE